MSIRGVNTGLPRFFSEEGEIRALLSLEELAICGGGVNLSVRVRIERSLID